MAANCRLRRLSVIRCVLAGLSAVENEADTHTTNESTRHDTTRHDTTQHNTLSSLTQQQARSSPYPVAIASSTTRLRSIAQPRFISRLVVSTPAHRTASSSLSPRRNHSTRIHRAAALFLTSFRLCVKLRRQPLARRVPSAALSSHSLPSNSLGVVRSSHGAPRCSCGGCAMLLHRPGTTPPGLSTRAAARRLHRASPFHSALLTPLARTATLRPVHYG